jgi:hypothetical protein
VYITSLYSKMSTLRCVILWDDDNAQWSGSFKVVEGNSWKKCCIVTDQYNFFFHCMKECCKHLKCWKWFRDEWHLASYCSYRLVDFLFALAVTINKILACPSEANWGWCMTYSTFWYCTRWKNIHHTQIKKILIGNFICSRDGERMYVLVQMVHSIPVVSWSNQKEREQNLFYNKPR